MERALVSGTGGVGSIPTRGTDINQIFVILALFLAMRNKIRQTLASVLGISSGQIELEAPKDETFGDYATNIALQLFAEIKNQNLPRRQEYKQPATKIKKTYQNLSSPRELAEVIASEIRGSKSEIRDLVDRVEVAGPGFINFWLKGGALTATLLQIIKDKENYGRSDLLLGKKILLEHTSPNTIKTLHVGHIRNNVLGMAVHNILEFCGADVKLDAINNDRGIHVMKAVWAYMKYGEGKTPQSIGEKPDHFVDKFYVMGVKAEEDESVKKEMQELLRRWEAGDKEVRSVWKKLRDWTFEGFQETYIRLGSSHDKQWFESEFYEKGKELVEEGIRKGVFRRLEDGAVLSNLEKYGLSDTIVLRADGTSMYHTQDLYLTKLKREKFPSDLYIWDIGPEQDLYLKQLFAMCEQLGIGKREDYFHLSYGFVYLKGKGKMSSREGTVVSADWLIEEAVKKAKEVILKSKTARGLGKKEVDYVAEMVGIGAIKYSLLKMARTTDLQFDLDESLSLEGNSGPYLQYTYARTQSVLRKFKAQSSKLKTPTKDLSPLKILKLGYSLDIPDLSSKLNEEELSLLRTFVHFPEVVEEAAKNYAPNILCNYLYDLASKFNLFYQKHRILESTKNSIELGGSSIPVAPTKLRLALTLACGFILKTGLKLLGIEAPERM